MLNNITDKYIKSTHLYYIQKNSKFANGTRTSQLNATKYGQSTKRLFVGSHNNTSTEKGTGRIRLK